MSTFSAAGINTVTVRICRTILQKKTAVVETPIRIGKNVWTGNGVTVFADVGNNSIVGAGAVVVKSVPANWWLRATPPGRFGKPVCRKRRKRPNMPEDKY